MVSKQLGGYDKGTWQIQQRDGRHAGGLPRYIGFSAYPQFGFHQNPGGQKFGIKFTKLC